MKFAFSGVIVQELYTVEEDLYLPVGYFKLQQVVGLLTGK